MPPVVTAYGLLGLIPFWAPPLMPLIAPAYSGSAAFVLALYGALILSFLGGARWGMAVGYNKPRALVVSVAMLPSLVGLALLMVGSDHWRLVGLAVALALHWVWDAWSAGMPLWYPRLRSILTAGAVLGLLAGAMTLP
jgi:ribose/xylose/arabinose/galactoside ABC-type transport system permease subunit